MVPNKNRKKIAGSVIITISLLVILAHQWAWPALGNYFRSRDVQCIDCSALVGYLVRTGQHPAPRNHDGGRIVSTGEETVQETMLRIQENNRGVCDNCAYLIAGILVHPLYSEEWQSAWDAFHAPRR